MKLQRTVASPKSFASLLSARAPSPRQETQALGCLGNSLDEGGGGKGGNGWRGAEQRELRRRVAGRSCLHRLRPGLGSPAPRRMVLLLRAVVASDPAGISSPRPARASEGQPLPGTEPLGRIPSFPSQEEDWNQTDRFDFRTTSERPF